MASGGRHGSPREPRGVIQISARGTTRKLSRNLRVAERDIATILANSLYASGQAGVKTLRDYAPERTGRLKRGIQIKSFNRSKRRPTITIGVLPDAIKAQQAGSLRSSYPFNYLPVTRFGRKAVHSTRPAVQIQRFHPRLNKKVGVTRRILFGRHLKLYSAASLRFNPGPPPDAEPSMIYRRSVKRYRPPAGDWVARAEPEIEKGATAEMADANQRILEALRSGRHQRTSGVTIRISKRTGRF